MAHFSQVVAAQVALNINDVEVCLIQVISEIKQIVVLVKLPKFLHLHIVDQLNPIGKDTGAIE